jgi:hypothetical protein
MGCIGIDIGYGYTKTCTSAGTMRFPTAVSPMTGEATFSELIPVKVNGKKYLVGDEAEREGGSLETRTSDFVASTPWLAILGHALDENRYDGGTLVLGVPPGIYTREYEQRIIDTIQASHITVTGTTRDYVFTGNIRIIPQGAGIYFKYIKNRADELKKNIAVIDIGHHTVDMALFSHGKYVETATESNEIGLSKVLDDIIKRFYREHNDTITCKEALALFTTGSVHYLGRQWSLEVEEEVANYADRINALINRYLKGLSLKPDTGIVGGGGAEIMRRFIRSDYQLLMVTEPVLANAVGYWLYGMEVENG